MFFQLGDELSSNPKIQALARRTMSGDLRGLAALGMWALAGTTCQAGLTDGVVSMQTLIANVLNAQVATELADLLVEVGLWHGHDHQCERCANPPEGSFIFHDWFDMRYELGEDVRITRGKRRELKDKKITGAVWLRDRLGKPVRGGDVQAACRYCGVLVWRKKDRGAWNYDHVHPKKYVGARNIVIACRECNQTKAQRLPSEAGMVLHRPGWRPGEADWDPHGETKKIESSLVAEPVESDVASPAGTTVPGLVAEALTVGAGSPALLVDSPALPDPAAAATSTAAQPNSLPPAAAHIRAAAAQTRLPVSAAAAEKLLSTRTRAWQGRAGQGREQEREEEGRGQGWAGAGLGEPESRSPVPRRRGKRGRRGLVPEVGESVLEEPPLEPERGEDVGLPDPDWVPEPDWGEESWDAGDAPVPVVGGEFGSPWFGWRGRPPEEDDAVCPEHGEHEPCRVCLREVWVNGREV